MELTIDPSKETKWRFYGKDLVILLPNLHEWPDYDGTSLNEDSLATPNHFFSMVGDLKFKQLLQARRILLVDDREVWDFDKYESNKFSFIKGILDFFKIAKIDSKVIFLNNNLLSNYRKIKHEPITSFLINNDLTNRDKESLLSFRNGTFKHRFVCLNRKPRKHRKQITEFIKEGNLRDTTLYTEDTFNEPGTTVFGHSWNELPNDIIKSCLINIVTETSFYRNEFFGEACFITEKTDKCLNSMMPFIIVGNPYTLKILRRLGFKTFNSIWDESYDTELDDNERMNKIKGVLTSINNWSEEELLTYSKELKKIVKYNYEQYEKLVLIKKNLITYDLTDDSYWSFVFYQDFLNLIDYDKKNYRG